MQGRFCGKNIRLISDTIDFCSFNKKPGLSLLADFKKAFDTVDLSFMKKGVSKYGFEKNFQKWISNLKGKGGIWVIDAMRGHSFIQTYWCLQGGV